MSLETDLIDWKTRAELAEEELAAERKRRMVRDAVAQDPELLHKQDAAELISRSVSFENGILKGLEPALSLFKLTHPTWTRNGNSKCAERVPTPGAVSDLERARRIFGKGSEADLANRLAMTNKGEYLKLRQVAIENNLL